MKKINFLKYGLLFIILSGIIIMSINNSCSSAKYAAKTPQSNKIENSPQFHNGKFRNPVAWEQPSFKEYSGTMWKFLFGGEQRTPDNRLPVRQVDLSYFNRTGVKQLNVTWLGHSSLMINIDGYKILADPVFEKRVSFFGPSRFNGNVPLDPAELPQIDLVLISHNHYDHLNKKSIQLLDEKTSRFIVPLAVGAQLEKWGVSTGKITELDWWDEFQFDDSLMIAATPTQHFSGRGLSDRDETLWASYVIRAPHHKIYFSGDSGYFAGFKQIGEKYGPFNMTFIECGAYNEKWHHIHMYPEETLQAHIDLRGNVLHPIHWATFNLSIHSWYEPMQRLTDSINGSNVKIATPIVGETTIFDDFLPSEKWWEKVMAKEK